MVNSFSNLEKTISYIIMVVSLIMVYSVYHSACILWTHYCLVKPVLKLQDIYSNFVGYPIFHSFTLFLCVLLQV